MEKMIKQEHIAKKIWHKPELQVLCRGESEENVLGGCKIDIGYSNTGPGGFSRCRTKPPQGPSYPCNIQALS